MRMLPLILVAACATPPATPDPAAVPFASLYLARTPDARLPTEMPKPTVTSPLKPPGAAEEVAGILEGPLDDSGDVAKKAMTQGELEILAYRRSPGIKQARERYRAALTGYAQAADLKDLVDMYRAFVRNGVSTNRIPAYPDVHALSGEVVARTVAIAFEQLRASIRDAVAAAGKAHADAARLHAARMIVAEDVALHESLLAILKARYEAGKAGQAGLLAFDARLAKMRTELEILDRQEAAVRARWNRLLDRSATAPVQLAVTAATPEAPPAKTPIERRQELRIAALAAERAAIGVRLAEAMNVVRPRKDFGVRDAQITEMRARQRAAVQHREAVGRNAQAEAADALFRVEASWRRWKVHKDQVVPKTEGAYKAALAAYEGNQTGYIELLDSARRLLAARLKQVDVRRDHAHARADLLRATGEREK